MPKGDTVVRLENTAKSAYDLIAGAIFSLVILAAPAQAPAAQVQKGGIEVLDVQFEPICQGKNIVRVQLKNGSDESRVFRIGVYTRSPDYGRNGVGWGTSFFDTVDAGQAKWSRFAFKIQGPITQGTYVRLSFYDAGPARGFDQEAYFASDRSKEHLKRVTYSSSDLEHREPDATPAVRAPAEQTKTIMGQFQRLQDAIRDAEYERAWDLFTRDYQQAEFQIRGIEAFKRIMEPERPIDSAFWWEKEPFLRLQPTSVTVRPDGLRLTAKDQDGQWQIDFRTEQDQWKVDWVGGYTPRILRWGNWEQHLLGRLEKRTTAHFDIYTFKDSYAHRNIEQIAEQKEDGYRAICEFLGKDPGARIRLVLFNDGQTKWAETGHQGMGWAYGNTIVEVHNEHQQLDPYHETTHILMGPIGNPPALFNEGFAVYMSERLGARALEDLSGGEKTIYERAGELKAKGEWIDLEKLMTYTEIGSQESRPYLAYPQAASFVKLLIEQYGKAKFLRAYGTVKNSNDQSIHEKNAAALAGIYGKPLQELREAWEATVERRDSHGSASTIEEVARDVPCALYDVTIPDAFKPYLSVGKLSVVGSPFYGVTPPERMRSLVRVRWSLKNRTDKALELKVNYFSRMTTARWKSGFGMPYVLGPGERRIINNIVPVASVAKPVRLGIRLEQLKPAGQPELRAKHEGVLTDPLPMGRIGPSECVVKAEQDAHFSVRTPRLVYEQAHGNVFCVGVTNRTEQERPVVAYAMVGDPTRFDVGLTDSLGSDVGPLAESLVRVPGGQAVTIRVPYVVPQSAPKPLLAFTLFEPSEAWPATDEGDLIRHAIEPLCWGWRDLRVAADAGDVKLPTYLPAEERAKLTAETKTEHFLIRYRPGSYAEQRLETIIREREEAYDKLSTVLHMELPCVVTLDLYPDMEAKGLGSGTTWTAANTRSNKHIAEVYDQTYMADPFHELAHIFSYHFPDYRSNKGGIVEAFAVYFGPNNMKVGPARENLRRRLSEGTLETLAETLARDYTSEANVVLVDFLLKKDVGKFKKLYVWASAEEGVAGLEQACGDIYGVSVAELERQWHRYLVDHLGT